MGILDTGDTGYRWITDKGGYLQLIAGLLSKRVALGIWGIRNFKGLYVILGDCT